MSETEPRTIKPLIEWDNPKMVNDAVIWWSKLDERHKVEVHRDPEDGHSAQLHIFDHGDEGRLLHSEAVDLSYDGAVFGPDMDDVVSWREKSVAFLNTD